jgi:hypothetical protein
MPSKCELVHNHRRSFQTATQRLAIRARKAETVTGFQPDRAIAEAPWRCSHPAVAHILPTDPADAVFFTAGSSWTRDSLKLLQPCHSHETAFLP